MTRYLITSALPYINGVKHLGTLVGKDIAPGTFTYYPSVAVNADSLMRLLWKVLEGVTARPTGRPSGSPDGPIETNNGLPDISSPPDAAQSRREAFLSQVRRFEAMGTGNGAAMAAQVVEIARSQGIELEADLIREPAALASHSA